MVFHYLALLYLFVHFFVAEKIVRKGKVAKSVNRTSFDKGSSFFIGITFCLILLMTVVSVQFFKDVEHLILPVLGLSLMVIASSIRIWSAATLGEFYTRTLVVVDSQKLIKSGPYSFIRHPGYLAMILLWTGFSMTSANLIVIAITVILILSVYLYRIKHEETMLLGLFKQEYESYKKHSYMLVPYVF